MRHLRWTIISVALILAAGGFGYLLLRVCGVTFRIGPQKIVASDDVIWLVPWENGQWTDGPGFDYHGASVTASEKSGLLKVNGITYGTLKIGDSVDLTTDGVVRVNDQPRQPDAAATR